MKISLVDFREVGMGLNHLVHLAENPLTFDLKKQGDLRGREGNFLIGNRQSNRFVGIKGDNNPHRISQ